MNIRKHDIRLTPSPERMLLRPFAPSGAQSEHILFRLFSTPEEERKKVLEKVLARFHSSSENLERTFLRHYGLVKHKAPTNFDPPRDLKLLIGACFTQQYSFESTALFNPSIVLDPSYNGSEDDIKFIMSLRAVGEGHVSSIIFREGTVTAAGDVYLKEVKPFVVEARRTNTRIYERNAFLRKLQEMNARNKVSEEIMEWLNDRFDYPALLSVTGEYKRQHLEENRMEVEETTNMVKLLAQSNFDVQFSQDQDLSERILFPISPSQTNGMEDARFVRFVEDDGSVKFYGTFTAFDGKKIMPELVETTDFCTFSFSTLNGPAAQNKGMALFPRKVNGMYMMIGRQDNESLYIMKSDNPYYWFDVQKLANPTFYWEFVQIGNCGSPIEIEEGWLLITHGVGPVRSYSLGVMLLDKNDPSKIIGRLKEPLLEPNAEESLGYVPNVLYTCGAMVHKRKLILPYAMSDVVTTFATIELDDLLAEMVK